MKKLTAFFAILLLVALAYIGSSYWFGLQTEHYYRQFPQAVKHNVGGPQLDIHIEDYQRRIFSSSAKTSITFSLPNTTGGDGPFKLHMEQLDEISHGPFPLPVDKPQSWGLAMAFIKSHLQTAKNNPSGIEDAAGTFLSLLRLQSFSTIHLDGTVASRLSVPAIESKGDSGIGISWGGMTSEFNFGFEQPFDSQGTLSAPKLQVTNDKGVLRVDALNSNWNLIVSSLATGRVEARIDRIELESMDKQKPINFSLKKLSLRQQSSETKGLLSVQSEFSYQGIDLDEDNLGPGKLVIGARNLDSESLIALQDSMRALQASGATPQQLQQQVLGLYMQKLPDILGKSPELEIGQLNFDLPGGYINGQLLLKYDGNQGVMLTDPTALMKSVFLDAELQMDTELMLQGLHKRVERELLAQHPQMGSQQRKELTRFTAEQRLKAMVVQGFIIEKGTQLEVKLKMESGNTILNGNPIDLSRFFGLR